MVGKWLGCIQLMCSKPGHSWQGLFFLKSLPLFLKSAFLDVFIEIDYRPCPPGKIIRMTTASFHDFHPKLILCFVYGSDLTFC